MSSFNILILLMVKGILKLLLIGIKTNFKQQSFLNTNLKLL